MTYLQLVNDVLVRLRESQVATVSATTLSALVGKFINDSKRQVEDAWNWDCLSASLPITTVAGTSNYVVTGSGVRQKSANVNNSTYKSRLSNVPIQWIIDQQDLSTVQQGQPAYYAWNGTNGTDSKVELFPTPNQADTIRFHMYVPQVPLSADADVILVNSEAAVAGAYARALVERGEDGAMTSSEAYSLFKGILADAIALEAGRFIENECWDAT